MVAAVIFIWISDDSIRAIMSVQVGELLPNESSIARESFHHQCGCSHLHLVLKRQNQGDQDCSGRAIVTKNYWCNRGILLGFLVVVIAVTYLSGSPKTTSRSSGLFKKGNYHLDESSAVGKSFLGLWQLSHCIIAMVAVIRIIRTVKVGKLPPK